MRAVRSWLFLVALLVVASCKSEDSFTDASTGDDTAIDAGGSVLELPDSVELGLVDCGANLTETFDVENTGGDDLDYSIVSSSPGLFSVEPSTGTIIAGTVTTFTVTGTVPADSVAGAALTAQLTVTTTPGGAPAVIDVSAIPQGGTVTLSPGSASFGDVELGLSGTEDVIVSNTGNSAVSVAIGDPGDNDYAVAFTDGSLAPAGSSTATVTYTPGGIGATTSSASITVTGVTCGAVPATLDMGGTGAPDGGVMVTGVTAFGDVNCGAASGTTTIRLTNDGNIPATWTSSFLADGENDSTRYSLSPSSGTIPAGELRDITLTRLAIAVPATPRAYDVTLRIVTTGQMVQNHDRVISQALHGPVLALGTASIDFGFAPNGQTLATPVNVSNSGDRNATATFTESGTHFVVPQAGATINTGNSGSFNASYAPSAAGNTTGSVAVTAPSACNAAISVTLAAGTGSWTNVGSGSVGRTCDGSPAGGNSSVFISNPGNQVLTLSGCTETSATDLDPVFSGLPLNVGSGGGSNSLSFSWDDPSPLRSGATAATFRCNTNEKHFTTRSFTVTRTIDGADLVLAPVTNLTFSCANTPDFTEKYLRITNNGNQDAFLFGNSSPPAPLYSVGSSFTIGSGGDVNTDRVGLGMGSGTCNSGVTGTIGVFTGSASVCSATPASSLTVTTSP